MSEFSVGMSSGVSVATPSMPSGGEGMSNGFSSKGFESFKPGKTFSDSEGIQGFSKNKGNDFAKSESLLKKESQERGIIDFDLTKNNEADYASDNGFDDNFGQDLANDVDAHFRNKSDSLKDNLDRKVEDFPTSLIDPVDIKDFSEIQTHDRVSSFGKDVGVKVRPQDEKVVPKKGEENPLEEPLSLNERESEPEVIKVSEPKSMQPSVEHLTESYSDKNLQKEARLNNSAISEPKVELEKESADHIHKPETHAEPETQLVPQGEQVVSVREELRLMEDTDELSIELAENEVLSSIESTSTVMSVENLQELVEEAHPQAQSSQQEELLVEPEAAKARGVKQEVKAEVAQETKSETKNSKKTPERKRLKLRINKAWFEKDTDTNSLRSWEMVKAYISAKYNRFKSDRERINGTAFALEIHSKRSEEKLQSRSIKRIEDDGSVEPYSKVIEGAGNEEDIQGLERYISEAEEEFTATNMTKSPTQEIVDADKISNVHNSQELFKANLDGEIVLVDLKNGKHAKKPEFVKVEVEEAA